MTFEQALAVFKKEAGLDVPVRYGGRAGLLGPIKSEGEELPIGAWFQLYQDQDVSGSILYVRDYGLLCTTKDTAPPDAPTLTEFWKQKLPSEGAEGTTRFERPGVHSRVSDAQAARTFNKVRR